MQKLREKINRNNLLYRLGLMTRRWRQVLDGEFFADSLTDATWRPLLHLHILGDKIRQKDLAASVGIEGPSLVRLLDTLAAKGLVQRLEDIHDRRTKRLSLTPEGRVAVARIQETVTSLENKLLSAFSDDEIETFGLFVMSLESTVNNLRKRMI